MQDKYLKAVKHDKNFDELEKWIDNVSEAITDLRDGYDQYSDGWNYNNGYLKALNDIKLRFCYDED